MIAHGFILSVENVLKLLMAKLYNKIVSIKCQLPYLNSDPVELPALKTS
jgi:hypothetical protein